jgi:hypothetical protein
MAATRTGRRPGTVKTQSAKTVATTEAKPVALTVKVDDKTYVRICTLGATRRRTNQDILHTAVQEYLDRLGA